MATLRLIKRRIKSVGNISQITKGMQMVAASKMRKAQEQAQAGKIYAQKILEAVGELCAKIDPRLHPLLTSGNSSGKRLVILISTNKGLCGGLNTNLFREVSLWFPAERDEVSSTTEFVSQPRKNEQCEFVTMGKKSQDFVVRTGRVLVADFSDKYPFVQNVSAVTTLAVEGFLKGEYKEVFLVFNSFVSALAQRPVKKPLLPLTTLELELKEEERLPIWGEFLIEPSPEEVLNSLLPHYLEIQLRSSILEAEASEHSARMLAMKNATDNALSLIAELTLEYNKLRQEAITYEIADMIRTKVAME